MVRTSQTGTEMPNTPPPTAPDDSISIARLHGEACFFCGAVNTPLHPAGNVTTPVDGGTRIWPIVACPQDTDRAAHHARTANPWLPEHGIIRTTEAGGDWDAIAVSTLDGLGNRILAGLGDQTGPVIEDTWGHTLYWLVAPGTAATWNAPGSEAFGPSCYIPVPWQYAAGGLTWKIPVFTDGSFTDTTRLHKVLQAEANHQPAQPHRPTNTTPEPQTNPPTPDERRDQ